MMSIVILGVLVFSIVIFCALQTRRYLTVLTGLVFAAAIGFMSGAEAVIVIAAVTVLLLIGQIFIPLLQDFGLSLFKLSPQTASMIVWRTLLLSTPAILIGLLAIFVSQQIGHWTYRQTVYAIPIAPALGCPRADNFWLICQQTSGGIEMDTDVAISRVFRHFRDQLNRQSEAPFFNDPSLTKEAATAKLNARLFEEGGLIKESLCHFGEDPKACEESCSFIEWVLPDRQCVRRSVLTKINGAYTRAYEELKQQFALVASEIDEETTADFLKKRIDWASAQLDTSQDNARAANANLFLLLRTISLVFTALSVLSTLKVVLLIYMRFLFHPQYGAQKISYDMRAEHQAEDIDVHIFRREPADDDPNLENDGDPARLDFMQPLLSKSWFVSFPSSSNPHRRGKLRIPQPLSFFLPRILTSKLLLSTYPAPLAEDFFGAYGSHEIKYVRIFLPPGRRIAVRIERLVAFCEHIKMRSIFDVKLSLLVQRRFLLRVVEGPGHIILSGKKGVVEHLRGDDGSAADPLDIIAFDMDGQYQINADHGVLSTYLDGYSLLSTGNSTAIATTSGERYRVTFRWLRRALFLILPI